MKNDNITVPISYAPFIEKVLTEMGIEFTKSEIESSAYWKDKSLEPEDKTKGVPLYAMYTVKINNTLAFMAGCLTKEKIK